MALHDIGINEIASVVSDAIQDGLAGTGTDPIVFSDTALQTPVVATIQSMNISLSDKTITATYVMTPAVGNGSTYYEWGVRMDGDVLLVRTLTAAVAKTSDTQINRIITLYFDRT